MKPAYLMGLGLWTPGFANLEQWNRDGEGDPEIVKPACQALGPRQRRATSLTTLMGAEVMEQAAHSAGFELSTSKLVFGSAYGEFQTAIDQLKMLEDDGRLSPARFKNSVHNTSTGLLSIVLKNRGFGTALAAGGATVAMCFLEALALLDTGGGTALIAVADECPGAPFSTPPDFSPFGAGFALSSEPQAGHLGVITELGRRAHFSTTLDQKEAVRGNPAAAALPLIEAVTKGRSGTVPLELDGDSPYCLDITQGLQA